MVALNRERLHTQLILEEGLRLQAYDDATGKPVPPGGVCRGNLTIGVGHNLDANPLTPSQIAFIGHDGRTGVITAQQALRLLDDDIDEASHLLDVYIPWWQLLDEIRARAIVDMNFNMGIHTFLTFKNFLNHLRGGAYEAAGDDLKNSLWFKQVGQRAVRLSGMIQTGEDYTS